MVSKIAVCSVLLVLLLCPTDAKDESESSGVLGVRVSADNSQALITPTFILSDRSTVRVTCEVIAKQNKHSYTWKWTSKSESGEETPSTVTRNYMTIRKDSDSKTWTCAPSERQDKEDHQHDEAVSGKATFTVQFVDARPMVTKMPKEKPDPIQFACLNNQGAVAVNDNFTWTFNGDKLPGGVKQDSDEKNRGRLSIAKPNNYTLGCYICSVNDQQHFAHCVQGSPDVQESAKSVNQMQGEQAQLECTYYGLPLSSVKWLFKLDMDDAQETPANIDAAFMAKEENAGRFSFEQNSQGYENGRLVITDLQFDDRRHYICEATNSLGSAQGTVLLRVRDKLAALWPFLGIVAEVLILVVIILLYERRQQAKDRAEEQEDNELKKPLSSTGDAEADVRQRAVKA